jgi:hypothetical protein
MTSQAARHTQFRFIVENHHSRLGMICFVQSQRNPCGDSCGLCRLGERCVFAKGTLGEAWLKERRRDLGEKDR